MKVIQDRIERWALSTLGDKSVNNREQRALRVLEEAIELAQSLGVSHDKTVKLAEYVYSRDVGEPTQEMAGVFVALATCAGALRSDLESVVLRECDRIETPEIVEKVRRRQVEKREVTK